MDSLAIQRSLTILEDRYRQLREIGEKRFSTWDKENADLKQQLAVQAESLQHSQIALTEAQEEAELLLLQLHQVQEELEHYFLRSRSSDQLAEAQAEQNTRAFALIGRMLRLQAVAPR